MNKSLPSIQPAEIEQMVIHWLNTPAGSYLGSGYGSNVKDTLQRPMTDTLADQVIAKLKKDVPLLGALPAGSVNIYAYEDAQWIDRQQLVIEVAGRVIDVPRS